MASPNSLFYALRVPRKVIVDHKIAELEVYALCGGFGRNHDRSLVAKIFHQCRTLVGGRRVRYAISSCIAFQPAVIYLLRFSIGVRPVEENNFPGKLGLLKDAEEIVLSPARLGEDEGFLLQRGVLVLLNLLRRSEAASKGSEKNLALGVLGDGDRKCMELSQSSHFLLHLPDLFW